MGVKTKELFRQLEADFEATQKIRLYTIISFWKKRAMLAEKALKLAVGDIEFEGKESTQARAKLRTFVNMNFDEDGNIKSETNA